MLIENDLMGRNISQSIIGIGININQEIFHSSALTPFHCYKSQKKSMIYLKY